MNRSNEGVAANDLRIARSGHQPRTFGQSVTGSRSPVSDNEAVSSARVDPLVTSPDVPRQARSAGWLTLAVPLGIFALTRVVDTAMLLQAAHHAGTTYAGVVNAWDGAWYHVISNDGYPSTLPRIDGQVSQNPWAFYPLLPGLAHVLTVLLPVSYTTAASIVATICGAVASCLLYRLVADASTRFTAATSVLALATFPAAPTLQLGYAEAPALMLVLGCLLSLRRGRYGVLCLLLLVLAFARPVELPLAAAMGVLWILRWRRRATDPFVRRDRVGLAASAVVALASFGLWPLTAALVTGEPNAYLLTRNAWIITGDDYHSWLGYLFVGDARGLIGILLFGTFLAIVLRPRARAWGTELRTWSCVYALYLIGTTGAGSSGIRYAMLSVIPYWPIPELAGEQWSRGRKVATLVTIAVIGFAMQYLWIRWFLVAGPALKSFP